MAKVTGIEPFYRELGEAIAARRIRGGMTQQELGDLLTPNRWRGYINNIEKGHQRVPVHVLVQIAEALGVLPEKLLPK